MSDTDAKAGPREWAGLVVLALPALLIALDFTALHLAVPELSADLQPSSTQLLWIVDIYGFMIAGLLVAMGTIGDRIGRRRLLLTGATAFGAVSVLAAFSSSPEMLIVARALLGIAGATLLPSTLSLISNMFRDPVQRRLAIAVWSAGFLLGGALGPVVGGALLEVFWWGSVFLLGVPVMVLLVAAGPFVLPEFRDEDAGRVDPLSVVLGLAAILPAVYGLKELAKDGPAPLPLLLLAAGIAVGWWFVRRQRGLASPLLDLALFSHRRFSVTLGAQMTGLFVLGAIQFLVMQYLQLVLGLSPLEAGLWTIPAMAAGIAGSLLVPLLTRRVKPVHAIAGGLAVAAAGLPLIGAAGTSGLALAVVGFTLVNLGINPAMVLTYEMIIGSAPPERAGTASGAAETGNELGVAFGLAVAGSIAAAVYRREVTDEALPAGTPPDVAEGARDTLGGAVEAAGDLPGDVGEQLLAVTRDAFLQGMQLTAVVLTVLLAAMAITVATLLRER
ncbi:MFS transporter [Conexibacter woesei]|uniref:Major facilitator superfamily MFS_1 n=1 Tax=Conexibacter woesei (strain DSM 14684 / CCUG 47730 / CIP 108061 / JCM 11494 / NBRC 100937 / ID131577) TaxID=469383 RepID=D3F772_CONWI|nr:MFS transporter [Conexibacter woesei]ADB48843.1 major facilitator superfamily MFS_1 [Conexibacter woesei DSM 14684]